MAGANTSSTQLPTPSPQKKEAGALHPAVPAAQRLATLPGFFTPDSLRTSKGYALLASGASFIMTTYSGLPAATSSSEFW